MKENVDWDEIASVVGTKVFRYFRGSFDDSIAADLSQETLLRLLRQYREGKVDPAKGSILMYAFGIARLVRLEALKNERKHSHQELLDIHILPGSDSSSLLESEQSIAVLRKAIKILPEQQQDIILLMIDKGMSLVNIAKLLGMPLGTVKSHVHRAKKTLLKNLTKMVEINNG